MGVWRICMLSLAALVVVGCTGDDDDQVATDGGTVVDGGEPVDGGAASDGGQPDAGRAPGLECRAGAFACAASEGCDNGYCGACTVADHCRAMEGCRADATCGECTESNECRTGERCRQGFCMPAEVPAWNLVVDPTDWAMLIGTPEMEIFVPCSLEVTGVVFAQGCRVRLRGGSSRTLPKKSFRITFDEGAPHPGYSRKINLRSEYNDGSFIRNFAAHHMFRQFTSKPVPATRYVQLDVNGEVYGLMVEVERIGGRFLERHDRDRTTTMYEADPSGEVNGRGGTSMIPLPDDATYRDAYDKKSGDPLDYADLRALIEDVIDADAQETNALPPTMTARMRGAIDVDAFVRYLAVQGLIQGLDHIKKNFYFARHDQGARGVQWEFYPWDLDLTFGCVYDIFDDNTICDQLQVDFPADEGQFGDDVTYPTSAFFNMMIRMVLGDPELRAAFDTQMCTMLADDAWVRRTPALINAVDETIRDAVARDSNDRNADDSAYMAAVQEVRDFVPMRSAYLRQAFACP